ncbi:ImmA/IrrE family metallo-endopeptidase [Variovorax sp. GT1P44]|uniref:ImmA/IrrE family metallo-endopeptidase n=1 Tax=Variovorax sp. GT1P44 TaxID=3443742 RepID=UPI003F45E692
MATLSLSPQTLEWAAAKVGLSLDALAEKIAAPSRLDLFLEGKLTPSQIEKVAAVARVPFGYLFLETPPTLKRPELPDLRQLPTADPLSDAFFETLEDVLRKKEWFAQYLTDVGANAPKFVGKFRDAQPPATPAVIAEDIRTVLEVTPEARAKCATAEAFYSYLAERLEAAGALVFKTGIVKSNSHRALPVGEFRGFAIADPLVPVVFVNGQDSPAAWVFTLMHEAAHLWVGHSGVSDSSASHDGAHSGLEALCNQTAGEVLVPSLEFVARWKAQTDSHLAVLSRVFKVSQLVVARRALHFGFIDRAQYLAVADASRKAAGKSGGNPYNTLPVRNSKRFTKALVASAMTGETLLRDAGSLLSVSPNTVVELGRRG